MLYQYEASDKDGVLVKGEFEADSKTAVVEYLEKKNLIPIKIEGEGPGEERLALSTNLFETVRPLDRIVFVRNLAAGLKAGLSIIDALDILIADASKNIMKNMLSQAKINLQNGQPLSQTFSTYRKYFPPMFVGMLRAGEYSGNLDSTLEELGVYLSREYGLVKKVKSALAYPVLLITASTGVILLLLTFVLPRLTKAFQQSKVKLPLITQVFVNLGAALSYNLVLDGVVLLFIIWFFTFFRKTKPGQRLFLKIMLRIPVAKDLVKKVALVRLTRTLGSLIASGVSVVEALKLSAESVSNEYYKKVLLEAVDQVTRGIPFSRTFKNYPDLFPHFLTSLIVVGEKTGTIEHVLKTFADFYDEEVDSTLKDLTNILEPILLLTMGLIIGTIALSVLLPIYQLVGSFK